MTTFIVSTLDDAGPGSLRAAITALNSSNAASNSIVFTVAGEIVLANSLPTILKPVTLDGMTAPGFAALGVPTVEINFGGNAGLTFSGASDGSAIFGLALGNSGSNGITLNSSGITLNANYIGIHADGTAFGNALDGIHVNSTSSGNLIGLNPESHPDTVTNVISGNGGNGIAFWGSSDNTVVGNRIGTDADGTTAVANGQNGILITNGAHDNMIGGTVYVDSSTGQANDPTGNKGTIVPPVLVTPPLGNLISGNGQNGVLIQNGSENNVLSGNFIGTDADGTAAIGNAGDGVQILNADNNALLGCDFYTEPFVYYNVLSGNGGNGVHITNSDNATIQANFFGIGADNATTVGNAQNGILVDGDSRDTTVGGVIPLGNVSAGNGQNGIYVTDTASGFTTFNTFGGLLAFQGSAPNGNNGILVDSTGGNILIRTNVFSGNTNNGIEITGDAWGVTVDPNIIGLDTTGGSTTVNTGIGIPSMANGGSGVVISGNAHDNIIGGNNGSVIPQNTFSNNGGYGIEITGSAYNNQVLNTAIGTNSLITSGFGNGQGGILVSTTGTGNLIGGVTANPDEPRANYISGNTGNGITLAAGVTGTQIVDNVIGENVLGAPLPNTGQQIDDESGTTNFIVGNEPGPTPPGTPPDITSNGGGPTASITMVTSQTLVTTVTAVDVDPGQTISYAITGGEDAALFQMVGGNQLSFITAPDLSDLPSAGATPGYQVTVSAADTVDAFSSQHITVWVSANPVLTAGSVSYYDAIGGVYVDLPAQIGQRGDVDASYWNGPSTVTPIAVDYFAGGINNATGSAFDDLLVGGNTSGRLDGLDGDDLLYASTAQAAADAERRHGPERRRRQQRPLRRWRLQHLPAGQRRRRRRQPGVGRRVADGGRHGLRQQHDLVRRDGGRPQRLCRPAQRPQRLCQRRRQQRRHLHARSLDRERAERDRFVRRRRHHRRQRSFRHRRRRQCRLALCRRRHRHLRLRRLPRQQPGHGIRHDRRIPARQRQDRPLGARHHRRQSADPDVGHVEHDLRRARSGRLQRQHGSGPDRDHHHDRRASALRLHPLTPRRRRRRSTAAVRQREA